MAKNKTASKTRIAHRDAKTGRFTTKKYADKHPDTTVREKVLIPVKDDTK